MNNIVLKINNIKKAVNDFFKINPHKHWESLLYAFFILVSFLILFSLYLLYQIKNEQVFQVKVEQNEKQNLVREDLLRKINNLNDLKVKRGSEIKDSVSVYKDPSI